MGVLRDDVTLEGPMLSAYCVDPGSSRVHESAAAAGERVLFSSLVRNGSPYTVYEEKQLTRSGLRPAVDVAEGGSSHIIQAELPGVRKEDINVEIGDNER